MLANFYFLREIYAAKIEARGSVVAEYSTSIMVVMGLMVVGLSAAVELSPAEMFRVQEDWVYLWIVLLSVISLIATVASLIWGQLCPVPDLYVKAIKHVRNRQVKRLSGLR